MEKLYLEKNWIVDFYFGEKNVKIEFRKNRPIFDEKQNYARHFCNTVGTDWLLKIFNLTTQLFNKRKYD